MCASVALLMAIALAACAAPPRVPAARAVPENTDGVEVVANGVADDEFLGMHRVRSQGIAQGGSPWRGEFVDIGLPVQDGHWLLGLVPAKGPVADPMRSPAFKSAIDQAFATMGRTLDELYPGNGGGRFVIYAPPAHTSYADEWSDIVTEEWDVILRFVMPAPEIGATPAACREWSVRATASLAHEWTHARRWFHREGRVDDFADEVVAYVVQGCILRAGGLESAAALGTAREGIPGPDESAAQVYARLHPAHSDSYVGSVVADAMLARATPADLPALCKRVARGGVDYRNDRAPFGPLPFGQFPAGVRP